MIVWILPGQSGGDRDKYQIEQKHEEGYLGAYVDTIDPVTALRVRFRPILSILYHCLSEPVESVL